MKLERGGIKSKVGRRILILFFTCMLLPVTALAIISFMQVSRKLSEEAQKRRSHESEMFGHLTLDRLRQLGLDLSDIAGELVETDQGITAPWSDEYRVYLEERFEAITVFMTGGAGSNLMGETAPPELNNSYIDHMREGKPLITAEQREDGEVEFLMTRLLHPSHPDLDMIVGRVREDFLWRVNEDVLDTDYTLTVLDESGNTLHTEFLTSPEFNREAVESIYSLHSSLDPRADRIRLRYEDRTYQTSYWSIPLNLEFRTTAWAIMLNELRSNVQNPIAEFGYYFLLVILASIWIVLLLSIAHIRRNLVPLKLLQEGTRRIAEQDFDSRVDFVSDDEFEELADSFNVMATQLGQQFNALSTTAEIDRAVLSLLNEERIIETVLRGGCDVLLCDGLVITIFESYSDQLPKSYSALRGIESLKTRFVQSLTRDEMDHLKGIPDLEALRVEEEPSPYLEPLAEKDLRSILLLPIRLQEKVEGVMALGYRDAALLTDEEKQQARQLADRFTVALSNARLVMNLDQMSWGTLLALARAIDASSPWTAGHSERVTALALSIGRQVGLSESELDTLHRGGLLHDLGKIGVPAKILDKEGRLTEKEREVMMGHTRIGARILQPIPVFPDVIPIVLQHHERWDGKGYPDGLAGDEISLGARVLAVADFYDALSSARPYRPAMEQQDVLRIIEEGSGSQFDPEVVEAFMDFIRSGQEVPEPEYMFDPGPGR